MHYFSFLGLGLGRLPPTSAEKFAGRRLDFLARWEDFPIEGRTGY